MPAGALRGRLDHGARTRVLEVPQAELDRIGERGRRELVDERFEREHVGVAAERAQRRGAHRHFRQEVLEHLLVREIVERNRVALAAAGGQRRVGRRRRLGGLLQVPARQQIDAFPPARAVVVRVAPDLVRPVDDLRKLHQ